MFDDVADTWETTITTGVDVKTGFVKLAIATPAELRGLSEAQLRARLPESARRSGVRTTFAEAPVTDMQHNDGGDLVVAPDGGACTTGFAVFDLATDTTGVLTAGHCTNDLDYRPEGGDSDGSDDRDTDWVRQHRDNDGDFQFHTTDDHGDFAEIYDSDDDRRDITGYRDEISNGDFFCNYGRFGDYDCSTVEDRRVSCTDEDGYRLKRLVAMEDSITLDGDSGGPWFLNGDAVGVHFGLVWDAGAYRSAFSWIVYADDAVDIGLLVN